MNPNDKTQLFESTPIPKAIATLAIPTVMSSLVMVLYNLADTPEVGTDTVTDTAGQWYDECVNWAASVGLYEGDTFGEDRAVTRAQAAHIIATAATYLGFPAPETGTGLADARD